jgi:hypothetical protein
LKIFRARGWCVLIRGKINFLAGCRNLEGKLPTANAWAGAGPPPEKPSTRGQCRAGGTAGGVGERPHWHGAAFCYCAFMNLIIVLLVLLLLFGGGGFYFGGPVIGGSGIGLLLLICLIVFVMGGFRTKN